MNSKAFTLFEIIIASVLAGVMMLGIVSSNISLQQYSVDVSNNNFVNSTIQTALNHILSDASKAVGSVDNIGVATYRGVRIKDSSGANTPYSTVDTGGAENFCFNIGANGSEVFSEDTPVWSCYTWTGSYNIYNCIRPLPGACTSSNTWIGKSKEKPSVTFMIDNSQAGNQKGLISVTITGCPYLSATTCCNPSDGGCAPDTSNPFITKTGSVIPTGHSVN